MTSSAIIGIIVFVVMIAAVLIGVPVYISVIACSLAGLLIVGGPGIVLQQFSAGVLTLSASYGFSVIPLFMIVGSLAADTGMADGIFVAARKWLGKRRGGLLYAVVGANAVFGACSAISSAGTVVFSKIAAPQLKKAGYEEKFALGCITTAGALSSLIPPSIGILTFCLITGISIGTGLICGISSGLLMILLMFITIKVTILIKPNTAPPVTEEDKAVTWKERLITLKFLLPILALFALIIGGSFFGWFPATVGGAVAVMAMLIYAIAKRVPAKRIFTSMWDGAQMFAGIFLIILASQLFSRFVSITGLANYVVNLISSANLSPFVVFMIVIVFYIFCGCVMDAMSMILITVPVIFPMLTALGFNEYVTCLSLVFLGELGAITPPVGLAVFTISNVLRESPSKIFRGVIPFIIIYLVALVLIVLFPELILWLPRLLGANV